MPTKIINVLKDDSFEDILDIFNEASANEVIFVLPKRHIALAEESHFSELAEASQENGKSVLILASNPIVNSFALKYNFGTLMNEKNSRPAKSIKTVPVLQEEDEQELLEPEAERISTESLKELAIEEDSDSDKRDGDQEEEGDDENEEGNEEGKVVENNEEESRWEDEGGTSTVFEVEEADVPEVELAAVKKQSRVMTDIIEPPSVEEKVKINVSTKPDKPFNVEVKKEKKTAIVDEIEDVWQSRSTQPLNTKPTNGLNQPSKIFNLPSSRLSFLNLHRKTVTYFGAGVAILFLIILYISTGSATIMIKPRASDLDFSIKVTASAKFSAIDAELKMIPGQLFTINKKVQETFQATGERDVAQKAKGKITVYNEYGTNAQTLIATTRFESEEGLIFRTLKTIIVPGTTVKNGEITPGKIEVEVIAEKAGDTYNIISGKFTIPAFKERGDVDRFDKYYGISEDSMKGGIVGKAKVVTDQDYFDAKEVVSKKLLSEMDENLQSQASGLKILTMSAPNFNEFTSSAQPDEATDTFVIAETAELVALGFNESDLYELIDRYIRNLNNLMILPEKLNLEFKDVKFNKEQEVLEFITVVTGPAYSNIDKELIISDLIGKNESEIKDYIKGVEGISSAKVALKPFWVTRVPTNRAKIKFELQY